MNTNDVLGQILFSPIHSRIYKWNILGYSFQLNNNSLNKKNKNFLIIIREKTLMLLNLRNKSSLFYKHTYVSKGKNIIIYTITETCKDIFQILHWFLSCKAHLGWIILFIITYLDISKERENLKAFNFYALKITLFCIKKSVFYLKQKF